MKGIEPTQRWQRLWPWLMALVVVAGAWIRLDQFTAQVLIDDEWHAVHQLLAHGPLEMLRDFGYADYSIPLGLLDWIEARTFGLSETAMRWPMLLCGLAALVLFPLYVAARLSRATTLVFAALLAMAPLLVVYSRIARPYGITLLLGWGAHAAYQRFHHHGRAATVAGFTYAIAASLAIWLHPIAAPFVLAPLLWGLYAHAAATRERRRGAMGRWLALAAGTTIVTALFVLPPLLGHPQSLTGKALADRPTFATLEGVWFAWLGTPSRVAVIFCVALAGVGARSVWRQLPIARTGVLGLALTLGAVLATGPMYVYNPLTLARYLLPFLPLLLLATAEGAVLLARRVAIPPSPFHAALGAGVAVLPCVALGWQSPLPAMLRFPNTQTLQATFHFDFRPEANPFLPRTAATPLSPYWAGLARNRPGSLRIAAAPFYFESYNWDAPRWEELSRQTVLPGYLTGLCLERRPGEVPDTAEFRFRNAVHLANPSDLAKKRIDYVVWQKPYVQAGTGRAEAIGADTAECEAALRAKLGKPLYEDSLIIVFNAAAQERASSDAQR
jgi:hypothetical protein